ncbi:MAG: ATP-binding protein [Candidatus Thermoplasmatota archaeon]|nr:ATP-binding protein [Euryarchaeota archaeon]MBU4032727.1 ATP-binding protein [Candidatus Thermoplasmatota archaeon]MBU4072275.1 ATP-binding protein [Candidatus Thermoplasmatota archaeon]MBU4144237.1 ATP-binding protein [Candidatus Thermoplasmatota archaeon]MBU4591418.1 ATP-binding protein [Candidatus Thermoplasmatota archaeon]
MNSKLENAVREHWDNPLPDIRERDVSMQFDSDLISDVIGPRRAGKTYLMFHAIKQLRERVPKEAIIYLNFENRKLMPVHGSMFNDLVEIIHAERLLEKYGKVYLFLDEVQRVPEWERYIRSIQDEFKGRIKITVSGSTAQLMNRDVTKLLTGRHLTTVVLPLSFKEHLAFMGITKEPTTERTEALVKGALEEYLTHGGYPEVVLSKGKEEMLAQLYSDAVARDVLPRVGSRGSATLSEFSDYLVSNAGNLLSFGKMSRYFKSVGAPISVPTLIRYFGHLREAFLVFDVTIYSTRIRDRLQYPRKAYCYDTGLANVIGGVGSGARYENAVAAEFVRRGITIHYWKDRAGYEVDFVVGRTRKTLAVQVCYDLSDPDVRKRELRGLERCMDELEISEGLVITRDEEGTADAGGRTVRVVPLWRWLLEEAPAHAAAPTAEASA